MSHNFTTIITNISQESHTIKAGERCVQLVIVPVPETEYIEEELNVTERGTNGFGSTGRGWLWKFLKRWLEQ